jgi:hypothetical protein
MVLTKSQYFEAELERPTDEEEPSALPNPATTSKSAPAAVGEGAQPAALTKSPSKPRASAFMGIAAAAARAAQNQSSTGDQPAALPG